jgi:hypothetical protein
MVNGLGMGKKTENEIFEIQAQAVKKGTFKPLCDCQTGSPNETRVNKLKKIITVVAGIALLAVVAFVVFVKPSGGEADAKTLVVYKSPTCGCCGNWITHMREAGYKVDVRNTNDMNAVKIKNGINPKFSSCHTALIDGYVVEGHVPASEVTRLLAERPAVLGIAVPGMPLGAPGMKQGNPSNWAEYDVLAFDGVGRASVFKHVQPTP